MRRRAASGPAEAAGSAISLNAIHADPMLMRSKDKTNRQVGGIGQVGKIKTTKLPVGGAFGLGLQGMLQDAVMFVRAWSSSSFKPRPSLRRDCEARVGIPDDGTDGHDLYLHYTGQLTTRMVD